MTGRPHPPIPPRAPDPAECCGEGCVHCVFDVYEAQLEQYRAALEQWRERSGDQDGQGSRPAREPVGPF